ncbi:MAG: glycoside hydrolase family 43 protein [Chloroflexi bacterium]|nr:glycoside hydrolase family 43 protein [Chloroflexota bacterium]
MLQFKNGSLGQQLGALISLILLAATPAARGADTAGKGEVLLFSFFRDNGQDGLYLAWSRDGLRWTELKPREKSFLQPKIGGRLMRDPCLRQGPDGTFRMVWTTGWGKPPVIGYAHSRDLLRWSEQKALPVMSHEPEARNAWAPELFYDETERQWLIFWATTIPGRFPETAQTGDNGWNHRIYFTTTKDFDSFAPTKLFYDGGFNIIDATLLKARGKHYLIVKDETKVPVRKHLRIALADRAEGHFSQAGPPISGDWVEGPSAIRMGDEFYIYFDHYARPQYYGAVKSRDLEHWQDISDSVSFPEGIRHGTVLKVAETIVQNMQSRTPQP